ncbi:hypothetical protein QN360_08755 [Glaciimonas sp. CA11.2]|uniref:hypothetical protein n=1 Tax=Glaciimonas sp. CA11.2 TaxID=3048601 RepID=UPI002AB56616|nr:hypothetical protein [Glaciimonas sp. CA11.2]MDY7545499.1 hypothetical protein [Glaciimonas sp. CA11.2]MEB0162998.1 hypothetical protein [Glaciimonas sp. CA11.2]
MSLPGYDETLTRFCLGKLKAGVDLQLTKSGDIALTRDGDLQAGNTQINALFRLVERWRQSESTVSDLFAPMLRASQQLEELSKTRALDKGPSLSMNPKDYHDVTESILEYQSVSSVLAGSILLVLNNLLQRLKKDLNASDDEWKLAGTKINNNSIGVIFTAAAANFRHHDEWACAKRPNTQQLQSMEVLCKGLNLPVLTHGFPTIRTNVCGQILMSLSHGSVDHLHQITFEYAKALSKYQ